MWKSESKWQYVKWKSESKWQLVSRQDAILYSLCSETVRDNMWNPAFEYDRELKFDIWYDINDSYYVPTN